MNPNVEKPEHCDLCAAPAVKGLRAGRGVMWLCEEHHQVMLRSMRTLGKAGLDYVKDRTSKALESRPMLRMFVDLVAAVRKAG